jgi:flagellar hook-associated protein 2
MATITSGTGVVSGIDYATLIDKLVSADSTISNSLTSENTTLKNQKTALTALIADLTALKTYTDSLGKDTLFDATTAASSNTGVISVTTTGNPTAGAYTYTALNMAQAQESESSSYSSTSSTVGSGTLTLRFGNSVDTSMSLSNINGGTGFTAGKIKITDRSGTSAVIDLTGAKTIDDVLNAINNNGSAGVTASVSGDSIVLTDNTGAITSSLKISEVNSGKTAASLGILGTSTTTTLTGSDIVSLSDNLSLDALNDGIGLETTGSSSLEDISYTLTDGTTTGHISLAGATTLGDVINKIHAASSALTATINSDGNGLIITDSTGGGSALTLIAENGSKALEDLGLTGTSVSGVITGSRIISGAKTVLLSDLNGGSGLGTLGTITITDRAGNHTDVVLSSAKTLEDVISAINNTASAATPKVKITAQVNDAGNGIKLVDSSGSTTSNLKVQEYNGGTTATKLFGGEVDVANDNVDGGDLHLQTVGLNTKLADLNGGSGVADGTFTITDSNGNSGTVTVGSDVTTIGDAVKAINLLSIGVYAEINDTGDGIIIEDTARGSGTLKVAEGDSTTATDLNLLGTATTKTIGGESTQVVDGSMTRTISLTADDTLTTLSTKIKSLNMGITASIVSGDSSSTYSLSLVSDKTGKATKFVVDTSKADIAFDTTTTAQDALLAVGTSGSSTKTKLVSSSTNTYTQVLNGATLTIKSASSSPVTVTVTEDTSSVESAIQSFVTNYNTFRTALNTDITYDSSTSTEATLTGDYSAYLADTELSKLVSTTYTSNDTIKSLVQLGISVSSSDGTLTLDQTTLESVLGTNLDDVKAFFTTSDTGLSAKFSNIIQSLAGETNSLMELKSTALQTTIDSNTQKISDWTTRLDNERSRLIAQFANLETFISKMQNNLSALGSISWITDTSSSSNSNSSLYFGSSSSS